MSESHQELPWWMSIVGAIVVLAIIDGCPRDSADTELAKATREAVELARDAQAQDRSAVIWTGRFRLLALIMGVSVPLVIVYLIWRSTCTSEIDPVEVIAELERLNPPELTPPTLRTLPINPRVVDSAAPPDGDPPTDATK